MGDTFPNKFNLGFKLIFVFSVFLLKNLFKLVFKSLFPFLVTHTSKYNKKVITQHFLPFTDRKIEPGHVRYKEKGHFKSTRDQHTADQTLETSRIAQDCKLRLYIKNNYGFNSECQRKRHDWTITRPCEHDSGDWRHFPFQDVVIGWTSSEMIMRFS